MRLLRIVFKGGLLAAHIVLGTMLAVLLGRRLLGAGFALWWNRVAAAILSLRVRRKGRPLAVPALYVANHVSWIEVVALGSIIPASFVAKDDLARWPLIGRMAAAAGTLFLRRGSPQAAARTVAAAADRLTEGGNVVVFPEGTSTSGEDVLPFRTSLFEAAAALGCDVQPVSVFYPRINGSRPVAPFISDDTFLSHLLRVLAEPEIIVEMSFTPRFSGRGRTRAELAAAAHAAVAAGLARQRTAAFGEAPSRGVFLQTTRLLTDALTGS